MFILFTNSSGKFSIVDTAQNKFIDYEESLKTLFTKKHEWWTAGPDGNSAKVIAGTYPKERILLEIPFIPSYEELANLHPELLI